MIKPVVLGLVASACLTGCTAFVTATHPDLPATGNICAPASDPRCKAFFADMTMFAGGIALQADATRDPGHYSAREDLIGVGLVLGVLVVDMVSLIVWPERQ